MKAIAFSIVTLVFALSSPGQVADPPAQEPLRIDAVTGFIHLLSKPELVYPKEALQQHIEGKVELELTVSPQGDVVSERVIWGPSVLQQATMNAFKKVKYIPFSRDGKPSVAFLRPIVDYEKDHATISTESAYALPELMGSGGQGNGRDLGFGTGAHGRQMANHLEILSDTQHVDFDAYLQRVVHDVRQNWQNAIPESARMKHGKVLIEFAITKDGQVRGMKLVAPSGDVQLDRAAWAGITASDPFPPLPSEFSGQYLALRFPFYYNPTKEELAPANSTTSGPVIK